MSVQLLPIEKAYLVKPSATDSRLVLGTVAYVNPRVALLSSGAETGSSLPYHSEPREALFFVEEGSRRWALVMPTL